jgi:plastocyanin
MTRDNLSAALFVAFAALLAAAPARAREFTVVIHHMELQQLPDDAAAGDVLTFSNEAEMAHNIYIVYPDGSVDNLDTQIPGVKKSVTLKQPGTATVRCWIHPIIKRELMIRPSPAAATSGKQ